MPENKIRRLGVRVTEEECSAVREKGKEFGLSLSEYIRLKILEPDRAIIISGETRDYLEKMRYEINRVGNNINQIARVANSKGFATAADLRDMTTHLRSVESLEQEIIKKHSKYFDGTLSDPEVMKLTGIARGTYYKYKRELKSETR